MRGMKNKASINEHKQIKDLSHEYIKLETQVKELQEENTKLKKEIEALQKKE